MFANLISLANSKSSLEKVFRGDTLLITRLKLRNWKRTGRKKIVLNIQINSSINISIHAFFSTFQIAKNFNYINTNVEKKHEKKKKYIYTHLSSFIKKLPKSSDIQTFWPLIWNTRHEKIERSGRFRRISALPALSVYRKTIFY